MIPKGKMNLLFNESNNLNYLKDISSIGPGGFVKSDRWAYENDSFFKQYGKFKLGQLFSPNLTLKESIFKKYNDDDSSNNVANVNSIAEPNGTNIWGNQGKTGCDSILGGSIKVQYGSSFRFDGVELYKMGIAGNFGSLGQYSLHFHVAGWGPKWTDYTENGVLRELTFTNSCNWRSYARWCVLHGTNFANISNNVFFISAGNGIFFEDGIENSNIIDHNLCLYATNTSLYNKNLNELNNKSGIIGNGGFDNNIVASIWMTNTSNIISRNVLACNPGFSLAVWIIGTAYWNKQGPANLATGYQKNKMILPGVCGGNSLVHINMQKRRKLIVNDYIKTKYCSEFNNNLDITLNIKNLQYGIIQPYLCIAENKVYNVGGFMLENNFDGPFTPVDNKGSLLNIFDDCYHCFDKTSFYMPANGELTASLPINSIRGTYSTLANNSNTYLNFRVTVQNLVWNILGPFKSGPVIGAETPGGLWWRQNGSSISINECFLGGDLYSTTGNAYTFDNLCKDLIPSFTYHNIITNGVLNGKSLTINMFGENNILGDYICNARRNLEIEQKNHDGKNIFVQCGLNTDLYHMDNIIYYDSKHPPNIKETTIKNRLGSDSQPLRFSKVNNKKNMNSKCISNIKSNCMLLKLESLENITNYLCNQIDSYNCDASS